ncbi:LysR family transcriptional regulator [Nodosilinea sp. E11]|uniref:LysR family transcriptional regulator n=1 Tax=Nodosilinea sp. E11 TaxID=3037479 RepID=UPI0029344770|nr:LysR family transcriptional regulator [Nodosilinea sp. E11]WOD40200.1 LysR family transcriptional regulator [Nodosilinea sp. E11]
MTQQLPSTKGITLHQMEVFEAVARHGSYTKAAEELYLSQPTVSIQVKQLSKTIGLPLFEMMGKKLYLTPAGDALLSTCRQILAQLSTLDDALLEFQGLERGTVKVATVESGKTALIKQLKPFMDSYPGLELSLYIGNHRQLLSRLQNNEDDIYLFSLPPALNGVEVFPCMEVPLHLVTHRQHPLAEQAVVTPQQLAQESWILSEWGSASRQLLEEFFAAQSIKVRRRLELSSYEAIKASIYAGLGIAVLPASSLSQAELDADLAILPVPEFALRKQWHLAYLKGKYLSPGAKVFLDHVLQRYAIPGSKV